MLCRRQVWGSEARTVVLSFSLEVGGANLLYRRHKFGGRKRDNAVPSSSLRVGGGLDVGGATMLSRRQGWGLKRETAVPSSSLGLGGGS